LKEEEISSKEILINRIYPAIKSCIDNRYKILISIFAFYSFILISENQNIKSHFNEIILYASLLFTLLTGLNSFNYIRNSKEQNDLEESRRNWWTRNAVESIFLIIILIIIWGAFLLLK